MPTLNYTTTVGVDKTVGEVMGLLAKTGASAVAIEYEDGRPRGVGFTLRTPHGERSYRLPVNVDGVLRLLSAPETRAALAKQRKGAAARGVDQAERVAWRVLKDWIEAQAAIIEAQMALLDEVMLPYLIVEPATRQTLYAAYRVHEDVLALEGGPVA